MTLRLALQRSMYVAVQPGEKVGSQAVIQSSVRASAMRGVSSLVSMPSGLALQRSM